MATYITVETQQGIELLDANQRQTKANRQRLAAIEASRRDKQLADEAKNAPVTVTTSEQAILSGQSQAKIREDELAAFRRGKKTGMASFWYWLDGYQNRNDWRIYCGNTSAYIDGSEFSTTLPNDAVGNSAGWSATWLALPVQANTCIAVMLARRYDSYGLPGGLSNLVVSCINRAYVVNTLAVRQIAIPETLQNIIDTILNPPGADAQYEEFTSELVNTNPFPPRQIYDANVGWAIGNTNEMTPTIYELLNLLQQYASPAQIKQFSASKNWIINDYRKGAAALDPIDRSYYYAEWLGDPSNVIEDPTLYKDRTDMTLELPSNFVDPQPPASTFDPNYGYIPQSYGDWHCWDWDDASYCRRMLLALGFQPTDLVP